MLSDEERKAIERLNIYKEKIKDELYPIIDFEEEKAIGTILNLIEKQSKEIEELKEDNQRYKRIASQKLDDIEEFRKNECEHRCIRNAEVLELKEYYQENYTPNDKIKAKIDEVDKDENASIPDFIEYAKEYATQKLQSLLEKE